MSCSPKPPPKGPRRNKPLGSRDMAVVSLALSTYAALYLSKVDAKIYLYLKAHGKELFHPFFSFISFLGSGEVLLFFLFLLLVLPAKITKGKEVFVRGMLALAITGIVSSVIKILVGRPRPFLLSHGYYWPHGPTLMNNFFSTPSGHTTATFALAWVLSSFFVKTKHLLWFWAFMVGISRVILFYHYPSDIVLSMAMGAIIGKWALRAKLPTLVERHLEA